MFNFHTLYILSHFKGVLFPLREFLHINLLPVTFYFLKSLQLFQNIRSKIFYERVCVLRTLQLLVYIFQGQWFIYKIWSHFDCMVNFAQVTREQKWKWLLGPSELKWKWLFGPCILVQAVTLQYNTILKSYRNNQIIIKYYCNISCNKLKPSLILYLQ